MRDRLARPGHRLELSPEETRTRGILEAIYRESGLRPPDAATIAAEKRISSAAIDKMTSLLVRQKILTRVDTLVFHAEALQKLKGEMIRAQGRRAGRASHR